MSFIKVLISHTLFLLSFSFGVLDTLSSKEGIIYVGVRQISVGAIFSTFRRMTEIVGEKGARELWLGFI
jgi:hypothetical protein